MIFDAFKHESAPDNETFNVMWSRVAVMDNAVTGRFLQAFSGIISAEQAEASNAVTSDTASNQVAEVNYSYPGPTVEASNTSSNSGGQVVAETYSAPVAAEVPVETLITKDFIPGTQAEQTNDANLKQIRLQIDAARAESVAQS